jgi:RHS repeat-associated protein
MKTNGINLSVATGTSSSLTYDLNGNMTSDGTNSYSWDAENRLLSIVYPGSGNNSQFAYDSFGRNVQILEYVSSSLSSTKEFVWGRDGKRPFKPCEARNASGTITAQYFSNGETISGTSYFYTATHDGSIHEMTNSTGTVQSQLAYDAFGQPTTIQGSMLPDFQYAGYYFHSRSRLNVTRTRAYSSALGRFINADPAGEAGGLNLYAYVGNPVNESDPSGLGNSVLCTLATYWQGLAIPQQSIMAFILGLAAGQAADRSGLPGKEGGPQDAFRHCLWSCEMEHILGDQSAAFFGDLHELENYCQGSSMESIQIDLSNNAAGRSTGKKSANCYEACMCLVKGGKLTTAKH